MARLLSAISTRHRNNLNFVTLMSWVKGAQSVRGEFTRVQFTNSFPAGSHGELFFTNHFSRQFGRLRNFLSAPRSFLWRRRVFDQRSTAPTITAFAQDDWKIRNDSDAEPRPPRGEFLGGFPRQRLPT